MWALIAALEGEYPASARIVGWVDAAYAQSGDPRPLGEQQSYERLMALLEAHLVQEETNTLAAQGARWSPAQAVHFAFERIVRRAAPRAG
jgi:hypothetical protein